jgi:hypothetical protein
MHAAASPLPSGQRRRPPPRRPPPPPRRASVACAPTPPRASLSMPDACSCPPRPLAGRDLEQVSICDRRRPPTAARSSWRRSASSAPPRPHHPVRPAALPAAHQEPARSSPAGHGGSSGGVRRHILHPQSTARLVSPPSQLAAAAISSRRPPVVGGGDGNFVVISGKMRGNLVLVGHAGDVAGGSYKFRLRARVLALESAKIGGSSRGAVFHGPSLHARSGAAPSPAKRTLELRHAMCSSVR